MHCPFSPGTLLYSTTTEGMKHLIIRSPDISNCFDKNYLKEFIIMKKILSVLLVVFAVSAIVMGCNRAQQDDVQKVDEKAVETETAQPAEPAK